MLSQFKNFIKNNGSDSFVIIVIILVALISFGIGRLTSPKTEPIQIKNLEKASIEDIEIKDQGKVYPPATEQSDVGRVVGSKNSDKYHLPDCPGAKQISEQNKVWFDSIEAAEKAGYKPAANCPGLKKEP
ncbi:MAG: hypothetical protein COU82_00720 [Candidatus Portnoybacteria bacterium CG10_big_fil_rev_8_21_14_0_10_38_18]|uniref:Ada DNA repair metal-binding domain-containing protein n=1 Tax=Candidatus Portnoybacteria bacterium CG10_big_fil_rev_8_21_14_0_10_38_18 TaxID=1974813 RepID=A0A2M8KCM4_9BACT|nr:MAG: hypothetical protein COU82_00720 [Candidatus Portnoybacteria bacterium CG10_big_fil_rev_8_21_14_0_10_38_18]